jgi:dihydrofolate reductase
MGQLTVIENVTLDGVMQAPGGADEDPRGGFTHGGWARPYLDHVMAEKMGDGMRADGALLFGRRTYTQFHSFWAGQSAVTDLKKTVDLAVLGSGELVRSLARAGLVDTYVLSVFPLTLGSGMTLFGDVETTMELVDTVSTTAGVIIATYRTPPRGDRR